jgi:predicted regulator of Ras-like GTPase activity (Roadblock/LC7/MglB family)
VAGLGDLEASQLSLLSALVGALGQASEGTGVGALSEAMIEGLNGSIVARSLGEDIGAVVVTEAKANLGLIRLELRKLPRSSP